METAWSRGHHLDPNHCVGALSCLFSTNVVLMLTSSHTSFLSRFLDHQSIFSFKLMFRVCLVVQEEKRRKVREMYLFFLLKINCNGKQDSSDKKARPLVELIQLLVRNRLTKHPIN